MIPIHCNVNYIPAACAGQHVYSYEVLLTCAVITLCYLWYEKSPTGPHWLLQLVCVIPEGAAHYVMRYNLLRHTVSGIWRGPACQMS